jgi:hypothetical protein
MEYDFVDFTYVAQDEIKSLNEQCSFKAFCLILNHGRMEFLDQQRDYHQRLKNDCAL